MSVWIAEDRSIRVKPGQLVKTGWVDIDKCKLGARVQMQPASVEKAFQKLLCLGDDAPWPPIVGEWSKDEQGDRFVVWDGRHQYLASLMLGKTALFVCWLDTTEEG